MPAGEEGGARRFRCGAEGGPRGRVSATGQRTPISSGCSGDSAPEEGGRWLAFRGEPWEGAKSVPKSGVKRVFRDPSLRDAARGRDAAYAAMSVSTMAATTRA